MVNMNRELNLNELETVTGGILSPEEISAYEFKINEECKIASAIYMKELEGYHQRKNTWLAGNPGKTPDLNAISYFNHPIKPSIIAQRTFLNEW